ncbi:hypothetical protein C2G38_2138817 [Gigaspora rosea]|uniref:Ion transport domain-containing protein n=1 Tax=Gigaspora rosea TaxID=44941 RepID=A0A397VZ96_9GLOM|nr:hypothetical protein C2G38_2138817 [Gigaspora rosea]
MFIFTIVVTLYLVNVIIGFLPSGMDEDKMRMTYLILRAEVLEEIELLYMLPHQRRNENWFPSIVFYECHTTRLLEHINDIQNNKWVGFKKPFIPKALKEILLLEE